MKAERLFSILNLLLQQRRISASDLSRQFEVSVRTIYRDIDALTLAGIPVYSTTGRDGGFELIEGFTIDKQLLHTGEVQKILSTIESLSGILGDKKTSALKNKLSTLLEVSRQKGIHLTPNHVFIEFSPSQHERLTISRIEKSIEEQSSLSISYRDSSNAITNRIVEPDALVYIWNAWYLYAYCRLRSGHRLFRISRITSAENIISKRKSAPIDLSSRPWNREWDNDKLEKVQIRISAGHAGKLSEMFTNVQINATDSDMIIADFNIPLNEWGLSQLMGLPGKFRIIKPVKLRKIIKKMAGDIFSENTDI